MTKPEQERISAWSFGREIQPGRYVIDDYDPTKPSVELQAKTSFERQHALANYEFYDYPGEYMEKKDGDQYVRTRIEELQAQFEVARGQTNARGLSTGYLVKLTGQPRADQNREYLVVSAQHQLTYSEYESMDESGSSYDCSFAMLSSRQPYRPQRLTPKPFVQGPQTAVVVGPSNDEIYTDQYGRVKVQFHWDREGEKNENSSCWIRVSHPWAGKNWGMIAIPRIGQEVIVDFLEGDPDQPIITGRVYNAEQMPPYALPANMTQTGILTRSSKGGSGANANELRFEDKKGSEQIYLHAEKNQDISVENDETHSVGHDRAKTIDNDETTHVKHDRIEVVDNDESIRIGRDRSMVIGQDKSETVARNKTIKVAGGHGETIAGSMTITVGTMLTENVLANYAETVGGAMEITVGAAMAMTVGGALAETIGAARVETVGGSSTETVGSNKTLTIGKTLSETVKGDKAIKVIKNSKEEVTEKKEITIGKEYFLKAKKIQLVAEDEINLKTGDAELVMKKNGDILINGNKINIKGSGDVIIKGSKIKEN
jgi:type VI secretion system secreted protein VgrG